MVRTAKVPLVKFEYDGIKVDIVVQNASGLFSGQAAKDAMNQMEQVDNFRFGYAIPATNNQS